MEELVEVLLAELGALAFELGLEGGDPFVVVVVGTDCGHVVGIVVSENVEGLANGYVVLVTWFKIAAYQDSIYFPRRKHTLRASTRHSENKNLRSHGGCL